MSSPLLGREPTRSQEAPPQDIHEPALRGWSPSPGKLQKLLQMPEYNLFGGAQTFESNFFQVTKNGQFINIHKDPNVVTIGILASSPRMLLPDLMIIAREKQGTTNKKQRSRGLEITRLIPLDLVKIFVCDLGKQQLKVQLATGQKYYLQLSAREGEADLLFERWVRLIYLTRIATGRIKTPENVPLRKPELRTIWKGSALQAKLTKRPPSREQVPHSAPKLMKQSATNRSAKVQSKSQMQPPSKWASHLSPARFSPGLKHSEAFTSRPMELASATGQLKRVRQPNFEKQKRPSSGISSESNPVPITLQKSKKEICLLQRTTMTSSSKESPKAIRKKEPATRSRQSSPGPSKPPGPPSQRKGPVIKSQSPKQNQPAGRVEPKASSMLVADGPSKAVQRKPKVGSEKESISVAPIHLANQTQNKKSDAYSGKPSKIVKNEPPAFSNSSPETGHPTSQEETGRQVHKVTMSIAVGTSHVTWKTVGVGPSVAVDPDLSNPPNKLPSANKFHEEQSKARDKKEMSSQVSEPKNRLKTVIKTAKQRSSVKFVTLYSILSSSAERLKKSKSKDGTKHTTPKASKHVTISGVIAQARKSIVFQEEKAGNTLAVSKPGTLDGGLDGDSMKAATVVVKKEHCPPSSQPQKVNEQRRH